MTVSGIYAIVNIVTGRRYVGSSVDVEARFKQHRRDLSSGKHHNSPLQLAWRKYGASGFRFETIECVEPQRLVEREQYHLDCTQPNVYNVAIVVAAPMLGRTHETSIKTRLKIGAANRGKARSPELREALRRQNLGKRHSVATRMKMSAAHSGKPSPKSPAHMELLRQHNIGRPLSATQRAKIGAAHRGRKQSADWIAKRAAAWIGRGHSEEARRKMRAARLAYLARTREVA
jgi:group I intron endonuclease